MTITVWQNTLKINYLHPVDQTYKSFHINCKYPRACFLVKNNYLQFCIFSGMKIFWKNKRKINGNIVRVGFYKCNGQTPYLEIYADNNTCCPLPRSDNGSRGTPTYRPPPTPHSDSPLVSLGPINTPLQLVK